MAHRRRPAMAVRLQYEDELAPLHERSVHSARWRDERDDSWAEHANHERRRRRAAVERTLQHARGRGGTPEEDGARLILETFYRDNAYTTSTRHDALVRHHRHSRRQPALQQCCAAVQSERKPAPDVVHARRLAQADELDVRLQHGGPAGHGLRLDEQLTVVGFSGGISAPVLASGVPLHATLVKVNGQRVATLAELGAELDRREDPDKQWTEPSGTSLFSFKRLSLKDGAPSTAKLVAKPGVTYYRVLRDCAVRTGKNKQNMKLGSYRKGELIEAVQESVNSEDLAVVRTHTQCIVAGGSCSGNHMAAAAPTNDGGWVKLRSSKGKKNLEKAPQVTERHGTGEVGAQRWAGVAPQDQAAEIVEQFRRREGSEWAWVLWDDFHDRGEDPVMHWHRRNAAVHIQAHVRGYFTRKKWAEYGHSRPLGHAAWPQGSSGAGSTLWVADGILDRGRTLTRATTRSRSRSRSIERVYPREPQHSDAHLCQVLFHAVVRDDEDAVVRVLESGVAVVGAGAVRDEDDRTALQLARSRGQQSNVTRLLEDEEAALAGTARNRSRSRSRSPGMLHRSPRRVQILEPEPEPEPEVYAVRNTGRRTTDHRRSRSRSPSPAVGSRRRSSPAAGARRVGSPNRTSPNRTAMVPWTPRRDLDGESSSNDSIVKRQRYRHTHRDRDMAEEWDRQVAQSAARSSPRRRALQQRGPTAERTGSREDGRRRAARSPAQHHRRRTMSRSPSPERPSLEPVAVRRNGLSPAQERLRAAEASRPERWRPASPGLGKTIVDRSGSGLPDLTADDIAITSGRSQSHERATARQRAAANTFAYEEDRQIAWYSIDGAAIAQLASYRAPPLSVLNVLRAALIALDQPLTFEVQSWSECRRMLADHEGFAETLKQADQRASVGKAKSWTQRRSDVVRTLLESSRDPDGDGSPRGTSPVTGALWEWTDQQLGHHEYDRGGTRASESILRIPDVEHDGMMRTPPRPARQNNRTSHGGTSPSIFSPGRAVESTHREDRRRSQSCERERSPSAGRSPRGDRERREDVMRAGEVEFAQRGGELEVRVETCTLLPQHPQYYGLGPAPVVALPHPFVTLSLARGDPKTEQKTKTAHKTSEAVYKESFNFVVPAARTARVRQRDKYDLRAGDGLLLVDVKDRGGRYTPLRSKAEVLGCAKLDLYDLFGSRGRWIKCRSVDGSMAGRKLEHACVLVRRRVEQPVAGGLSLQQPAGESGLMDQVESGLKKIARAVSPNPKPRPFDDTVGSSVPRWEADDDGAWETGEVVLTMIFTPNANVNQSGDERQALT